MNSSGLAPRKEEAERRLTKFTGVVGFGLTLPPEIVPAVGISATSTASPPSGPPVTPSSLPALVQVPPVFLAAVEGRARDLVRVVAVDLDGRCEAAVGRRGDARERDAGRLADILELAAKAKERLEASDAVVECTTLVAGPRNCCFLLVAERDIPYRRNAC